MPRRLAPFVAGSLLALAVLSLLATALLNRPRADGASFSAQEVGTAPEVQRQMLADGVVTEAEMTLAVEAQRACLQKAGYSPEPIGPEGPGAGFTIEVDYSDEPDPAAADRAFLATSAACEAEHVSLVGRAYASQGD